MTNAYRLGLAAVMTATLAGGCQLVSGLSGLHPGSGGAGGATSSAGSTGGARGLSTSTGATTASTGASTASTGASTTAVSSSSATTSASSSSSGGCSCSGGCMSPTCTLVDDPGGVVTSLASDGTYVYWSVTGALTKPATGFIQRQLIMGADTPHAVANAISPTQIAVDKSDVYWTDQQIDPSLNGIASSASDGSGQPTVLFSTNQFAVQVGLLLSGTTLSWDVPTEGQIQYGSIGGGSAYLVVATISAPPARNLAADTGNVYWVDAPYIWKQPTGQNAGMLTQLVTTANVTNLVADATDPGGSIYWAVPSGILALPKAGGSPALLTSTVVTGDLLVDPDYVYFTTQGNNTCTAPQVIEAVALKDGMPQMIQHLQGCTILAQDTMNLFWTDGGHIWRFVKP